MDSILILPNKESYFIELNCNYRSTLNIIYINVNI